MTIPISFMGKEKLTKHLATLQKEVHKALSHLEKCYKSGRGIKEAEETYRATRRARDSVLAELSIIAVFEIAKAEEKKNDKSR